MDVVGYRWWTVNWGSDGDDGMAWLKLGPIAFAVFGNGGRGIYVFGGRWRWERGVLDD